MHIQDSGYLLHIRAYRESSAIVRFITVRHGLVCGVVKGVYKKDKRAAAYRAALQLGNALELSWFGKNDLKTLAQIETASLFPAPDQRLFLCLHYVNELLLHFLQEGIASEEIYQRYHLLLTNLAAFHDDIPTMLLEANLRAFEFDLLESLGFAMDFGFDETGQKPVEAANRYHVIAGVGVQRLPEVDRSGFSGAVLLAIANRDFSDEKCLRAAKIISRYLLDFHLEGKTLKTRRLYREMM